MADTLRNIFSGIGSVLDIFPSTDYSRFVPTESSFDMVRKSFEQVGASLSEAFEQTALDGKETSSKSGSCELRAE